MQVNVMSSDDKGPQKNTETHWQEKYFAVVYVLDCELWKWYNEFNYDLGNLDRRRQLSFLACGAFSTEVAYPFVTKY